MSAEPFLDKLGKEIKPGAWIVYGHALGCCAALRIGLVLDVKRGPETQYTWPREGRITVWGIDDDHLSYSKNHPNEDWVKIKALLKKSTLFSSRTLVIDPKLVPEEYKKALEDKMTPELKMHVNLRLPLNISA